MTWDELDLDKALWSLPASRTKNRQEHTKVPAIGCGCFAVIREMPRRRTVHLHDERHPPCRQLRQRQGSHRSGYLPRWTFHDLRRTAVSGMARLGIPLAVIEKVVNHTSGSFAGIVGVYASAIRSPTGKRKSRYHGRNCWKERHRPKPTA